MLLAGVLAFLIGIALGVLGGGGAILTVPVLVTALGVGTRSAFAMSLVVVGATSAVAAAARIWRGTVALPVAGLFALTGVPVAFVAGRLSARVPAQLLLLLLAAVMAVTAVTMWRPRAEAGVAAAAPLTRAVVARVLGLGAAVGTLTGFLGAGGGFLIVPALTVLLGMPMQRAIGTSLTIIALQSAAGAVAQGSHATVDWELTAGFTAAAILGSGVGTLLSPHIPPALLRRVFAVLLLAVALGLLWQQLHAVS